MKLWLFPRARLDSFARSRRHCISRPLLLLLRSAPVPLPFPYTCRTRRTCLCQIAVLLSRAPLSPCGTIVRVRAHIRGDAFYDCETRNATKLFAESFVIQYLLSPFFGVSEATRREARSLENNSINQEGSSSRVSILI